MAYVVAPSFACWRKDKDSRIPRVRALFGR
jgi:hypothetical protein